MKPYEPLAKPGFSGQTKHKPKSLPKNSAHYAWIKKLFVWSQEQHTLKCDGRSIMVLGCFYANSATDYQKKHQQSNVPKDTREECNCFLGELKTMWPREMCLTEAQESKQLYNKVLQLYYALLVMVICCVWMLFPWHLMAYKDIQ